MRERPMLFSAPMVRAILSGEKTQTRRAVRPQPDVARPGDISTGAALAARSTSDDKHLGRLGAVIQCPHGQPGDRLWVREAWQSLGIHDRLRPREIPPGSEVQYPASHEGWVSKRRPSIHMPRWASRIALEITGVRVERLRDISETDALAEGVTVEDQHKRGYCAGQSLPPAVRAFRELWDSINGPGSWGANPWVWVIEFRRI